MSQESSPGATLIEMLRDRAERRGGDLSYTFLLDGETAEAHLTYGELDRRARGLAATLAREGITAGERVLLLYPPGLDYITAFFGCLYAGAVAVPAYPPRSRRPSARLASNFFTDTPFSGQVNLLTTGSFETPQQFILDAFASQGLETAAHRVVRHPFAASSTEYFAKISARAISSLQAIPLRAWTGGLRALLSKYSRPADLRAGGSVSLQRRAAVETARHFEDRRFRAETARPSNVSNAPKKRRQHSHKQKSVIPSRSEAVSRLEIAESSRALKFFLEL